MALYCTTKEQVDEVYLMNDQYKTYGNIRNFPMMFLMNANGQPPILTYNRPKAHSIKKKRAYMKARRSKQLKGQTKIDKYFK